MLLCSTTVYKYSTTYSENVRVQAPRFRERAASRAPECRGPRERGAVQVAQASRARESFLSCARARETLRVSLAFGAVARSALAKGSHTSREEAQNGVPRARSPRPGILCAVAEDGTIVAAGT